MRTGIRSRAEGVLAIAVGTLTGAVTGAACERQGRRSPDGAHVAPPQGLAAAPRGALSSVPSRATGGALPQ
jgi:hypothetical protein